MQHHIRLTGDHAHFNRGVQEEQLADLFCVRDLDAAMDRAARRSYAMVAEYLAAPLMAEGGQDHPSLEFFVPAAITDSFAQYLEMHLRQICPRYAAWRDSGCFGPLSLHTVPSGTFHQWRMSWENLPALVPQKRWQDDRFLMESILWQVRMGWSD